MGAALETKGLMKLFGALAVANNVSLTVEQGARHALIGPNGAGKTTLVNLLTGVLVPNAGRVILNNVDITDEPQYRRVSLGLARTFQASRIFKRMTVMEHLLVGRHLHQRTGLWGAIARPIWVTREEEEARERGRRILALFEDHLLPHLDHFADTLSYANKRRLEIARALVGEPRLLLLDEPTAGMNPHESAGVVELMRTVRDMGVTVLLFEHDMEVNMGVSERIVVLDHGEKIAEGRPEVIRADEGVIRAYMGRRHGRA